MTDISGALKIELEEILTTVAKVKNLTNFQVQSNLTAELGDGFVSQFFKGNKIIDKTTGKVTEVAIKKIPKYDLDIKKLFNNEILFYSKILPVLLELQKNHNFENPFNNTPTYFTSKSDIGKQFIALEDLTPKGYVLHEKKDYFSKEQLERLFNLYGKFHGLSYVLCRQNNQIYQETISQFEDILDIFIEHESSRDLWKGSIEGAINELQHRNINAFEKCKTILEDSIGYFKKSHLYDGKYPCMLHGDCWSNNMLFKYSKDGKLEDIKLIDFQLTHAGSPVFDLSYFFYSGASKQDLDQLETYLNIYHESLSSTIEKLGFDPRQFMSLSELTQEWKDYAGYGVILGIYLWQVKLLDKANIVDFFKDLTDGDNREIRSKMFKKHVDLVVSSEPFKERVTNILIHACEFGIFTKEIP